MALDIAIQNCLNHFDYQQAVNIYLQYKGEDFLYKTIFSRRSNEYAMEKVKRELQQLLDDLRSTNREATKDIPHFDVDHALATKKKTAINALKSAAHLHGQLEITTDDEKRYHLCKEIVRLRGINASNWRAIRGFEEKGYFQETVEKVETTVKLRDKLKGVDSLHRQLMNARSNVTKHRKKGNEKLLQKWETIRDEILKTLEGHE